MHNPNDPTLRSWVKYNSNTDFPIQNLPFGIYKTKTKSARVGVAIGDQILDLSEIYNAGLLNSVAEIQRNVFNQSSLNVFFSYGRKTIGSVRTEISKLLDVNNSIVQDDKELFPKVIDDQVDAEMLMPVEVGDYTDFYSSEEHARNVGTMFRDPDNALLPNWKHLPVGYHGRASSIVISGTPVKRPKGQMMPQGAATPIFGPCKLMDFELEMAFITCGNNTLGESIPVEKAEDYIAGFVLFNDWSARDIQKWEYQPLGPFLAKNFASSISPWVVTLDALEPFRVAGPKQDPQVLPYLQSTGNHNFDIDLDVFVQPANSQESRVSTSNFRFMYWNIAQQLAHHTVNGCNINTGDMYASGTISGPNEDSYGSMLELAWKGTKPIKLIGGEERKFIQDGDTVIMRGYAQKENVKIGFGEVSGKVLPAD